MFCCECREEIKDNPIITIINLFIDKTTNKEYGSIQRYTCQGCYRMGKDLLTESYQVGYGNLRRMIVDWYGFDYITNESIGRFD
jgi:hypothetical protein